MSRLSCILSALFLNILLLGCSTTLATRAPRGVDMSGEWELDTALSDFPQEAVSAQPAIGGSSDSSGNTGGGRNGGRGGRGRGGMGGGASPLAGGPSGRAGSPEHHFAMPPHLTITQTATGLSVDVTMPDGKHVINNYTSGEKSVVTTTRGAADRTLGWDGDSYLIRTKVGEKGPQSEVLYSIESDGMLSVTSTITNSGIYNFQYTLEYGRVKR